MTNREAIEFLKNIIDSKAVTLIDNNFTARYHIEALEKAIKSLEKEAKREERLAKIKAEKEKFKALSIQYQYLKEGDLFKTSYDSGIYRRDKEGSTLIFNKSGEPCNFKSYPYLTMKVCKV